MTKPAKKAAPKKVKAKNPESSVKTGGGVANLIPWKPGQSGNPSGRPAIIREVRDIARAHTTTAIETLVSIMCDVGAPAAARVASAAHILDRGYGKPTQNINATVRNLKQMTDDELIAFLSGVDEADGGEGVAEAPSSSSQLN